jgi:hypothetical protein
VFVAQGASATKGTATAECEQPTPVVSVADLGKVMPWLPPEHIARCRETGDLHRLQLLLRRETGVANVELASKAAVPLLPSGLHRRPSGGTGVLSSVGDQRDAASSSGIERPVTEWSPILCPPVEPTGVPKGRGASSAASSKSVSSLATKGRRDVGEHRMNVTLLQESQHDVPMSLRLTSLQYGKAHTLAALPPSCAQRHPGTTREPEAPTAELQWLCNTGHLTGRRCSVYWPMVDACKQALL